MPPLPSLQRRPRAERDTGGARVEPYQPTVKEALMNRFAFVFAGALALHAASVIAAQRTFVASGGRDANPCAQPCRSFSHAMFYTDPTRAKSSCSTRPVTAPVTISKSISI